MAGLSAADRQKLALLETLDGKVAHVHGLVERFAADPDAEQWVQAIRRSFSQLKLQFMGAGLDAMSQLCGAMDMAARRGGSRVTKIRILREGVGSLRQQLELEQRAVRTSAADKPTDESETNDDVRRPPPPGEP